MNVSRFTARTSREALALVREAFGQDAVVLSTRPCSEGVEILAMPPEGVHHIEQLSDTAPQSKPAPAAKGKGKADEVGADVEKLSMSTLSFQDYVRERMLRRRQAALKKDHAEATLPPDSDFAEPPLPEPVRIAPAPVQPARADRAPVRAPRAEPRPEAHHETRLEGMAARHQFHAPREQVRVVSDVPSLADAPAAHGASAASVALQRREQQDMMAELRSMRGLIEERFGALAFMDKLQRHPTQARLAQKLLDAGFSPALIRKLGDGMGADVTDELAWAQAVLERNLHTGESESALEDQGGVFAMIGSTGVGKTTSTAKIAAAFATKHGAANLGLITLDAYRVAAHEQLRAYGRILGVPVHTAHDRVTLEDLLDLLSAKKMVLIDTAGIGQRDSRTRELLDMLAHRSINRVLVVNAAAQGETIEDVLMAYRANQCAGVVLSKLDEALKLGPALDALIRHKLKVIGVANGQRVPEDWHRLSAHALVQRAMHAITASAFRLDPADVSLVFSSAQRGQPAAALHA